MQVEADNVISNETSYLHVADALVRRRAPGRAYIGVGPEQNFSYIGLARPDVAFIVDHRRDNALLHLFHHALFLSARRRTDFLTMLLGRRRPAHDDPSADIDRVLAAATQGPPDRAVFVEIGVEVEAKLAAEGYFLTEGDKAALARIRETLFARQLDLSPRSLSPDEPRAPPLRALFLARDGHRARRSFLAREASYRYVAALHARGRVIPVVGDFAGHWAFAEIARVLVAERLKVGVLYASNVEQFLVEGDWPQWMANVRGLPHDDGSVFVRSWLGVPPRTPRHPRQVHGHATATFVQPLAPFASLARPPASAWDVASAPASE